MMLRVVQILFIVCVLWTCSALTTFGRVRPFSHRPVQILHYSFDDDLEQTTTEVQGKEYGKESKYYEQNNEKQFYVSEQKLTWNDAWDACTKMGMALTSPTTYSDQQNLINYISAHSLTPEDNLSGYWIGSHRLSMDDPWTWKINGQVIKHFGWLPGEPNGYEGEDCMELKKDYQLGWNNYYCGGYRRYICENLPHTFESDKNVIEDLKDSLHEEVVKEINNKAHQIKNVYQPMIDSTIEDTTTSSPEIVNNFDRLYDDDFGKSRVVFNEPEEITPNTKLPVNNNFRQRDVDLELEQYKIKLDDSSYQHLISLLKKSTDEVDLTRIPTEVIAREDSSDVPAVQSDLIQESFNAEPDQYNPLVDFSVLSDDQQELIRKSVSNDPEAWVLNEGIIEDFTPSSQSPIFGNPAYDDIVDDYYSSGSYDDPDLI